MLVSDRSSRRIEKHTRKATEPKIDRYIIHPFVWIQCLKLALKNEIDENMAVAASCTEL